MKNLEKYHIVDILTERKESGIPILGICLGMQILFEKGYEVKETKGLGFIPGSVRYMDIDEKIPHMGWNQLHITNHQPILKYVHENDDVYLYTGLTSVSKDASNVGFALINLRTKEGKYYHISGAEEYSAMSSAEGKVQNLKYKATFPILVNAGGEPTYFLSLKDSSNLVKMYAFVSVKNYQIVATGSSVSEAEKSLL